MIRSLLLAKLFLVWSFSSTALANDELITLPSKHSVTATVQRLQDGISANGWRVLGVVDQAAQAAEYGVKIPPRTTIIFAKMEAWIMFLIQSPTVAIELGHRVLVWEDEYGVWVTRNTMKHYLRHTLGRHELRAMPVALQLFDNEYGAVVERSTQ